MSEEKKAWFKNYKCGQCYYLKGYGRGGETCEVKYNVTEKSTACPSFKLKENVQTCRQCKWLDTKSRGKDCRERGFDEQSKSCFQYTQAPHGYAQVNGRVMVGDTIANTFEVDTDKESVPFLIKQGLHGILVTVTPGKNGSPPRYSVKTIELQKDGKAVMEEPVLGKPRIAFLGKPEAETDDNGLVSLSFSVTTGKSKNEPSALLEQLLSSKSVAVEKTETLVPDDLIYQMYKSIVDQEGVLDKNILEIVKEYGVKYNWDLATRDQMASKLRTRFDV